MTHWGSNLGSSEYTRIFVPISLTHAERGRIVANLEGQLLQVYKPDTSDWNVSAKMFFSDRKLFFDKMLSEIFGVFFYFKQDSFHVDLDI